MDPPSNAEATKQCPYCADQILAEMSIAKIYCKGSILRLNRQDFLETLQK